MPREAAARPIHLLVDPTPGGGGIAAYCALAAPLIADALGRQVRILKRDGTEPLPRFRARVVGAALAAGSALAEVEAPETGAATLLLGPGCPVHLRLHLGRSVAAAWEGRTADPLEMAGEQAVLARAACVSAPSRVAVEVTASMLALPARVLVYPNPAPPAAPLPPASCAGRGLRVVALARSHSLKGAGVLPMLLRHLPPDITLRLAGRGTERLARALGGGPRIAGLGELCRDATATEIGAADVVLVPSLIETFSMVAAEAIALGRPVAAWADLGAAEWLQGLVWTAPRWDPAALADATLHAAAEGAEVDPRRWTAAATACRDAFVAGAKEAAGVVLGAEPLRAPSFRPDPPLALLRAPAALEERFARKAGKLIRDPVAFFRDAARNHGAARVRCSPTEVEAAP